MQSSAFNLPFQIVINHLMMSNNCNKLFPPVLSSYIVSDTPEVVLEEEQPKIA